MTDYLIFSTNKLNATGEFDAVELPEGVWVGGPRVGYVNQFSVMSRPARKQITPDTPLYFRVMGPNGPIGEWTEAEGKHGGKRPYTIKSGDRIIFEAGRLKARLVPPGNPIGTNLSTEAQVYAWS